MESLSDIVAQIRAAAYIQNADPPKSVLRLADRIEAAWRRDEERAVEHATRHAEAVARDNCRDCIHNPNGKNYEHVGNAAASKGKWKNGTMYEYEYAYCSECGRMEWAGWDTHEQAKENIESFANDYKFCPGCGAEMEGGVYVK